MVQFVCYYSWKEFNSFVWFLACCWKPKGLKVIRQRFWGNSSFIIFWWKGRNLPFYLYFLLAMKQKESLYGLQIICRNCMFGKILIKLKSKMLSASQITRSFFQKYLLNALVVTILGYQFRGLGLKTNESLHGPLSFLSFQGLWKKEFLLGTLC